MNRTLTLSLLAFAALAGPSCATPDGPEESAPMLQVDPDQGAKELSEASNASFDDNESSDDDLTDDPDAALTQEQLDVLARAEAEISGAGPVRPTGVITPAAPVPVVDYNKIARVQPLPKHVRFIDGFSDVDVQGTLRNASDLKVYDASWTEWNKRFNIIGGRTKRASVVMNYRREKKIFAHSVNAKYATKDLPVPYKALASEVWLGPPFDAAKLPETIDSSLFKYDASKSAHTTRLKRGVRELALKWTAVLNNTLSKTLPGGFDAIVIDEFNSFPDGSIGGETFRRALRVAREANPHKLIFVYSVGGIAAHTPRVSQYSNFFKSIYAHADLYFLENYRYTSNPQIRYFEITNRNIKRTHPGAFKKTVNILAIWAEQSRFQCVDGTPAGASGACKATQEMLAKDPTRIKYLGVPSKCAKANNCETTVDLLNEEHAAMLKYPTASESRNTGIGYWISYRSNDLVKNELFRISDFGIRDKYKNYVPPKPRDDQ